MKEYKFKLTGLDCPNCANELESSLKKVPGINEVKVNFMMQRLTFSCLEEDKENVLKQIKKVINRVEPDVRMEV